MIYSQLIGLGLTFLSQFLGSLISSKAPQEVIDAIQASIAALQKHQADVMSKADWESQRN